MILLVFGGRDYADEARMFELLDRYHAKYNVTFVVEGDAGGADKMAGRWAESRGIHYAAVPALWKANGRSAGPKRNRAMLLLKPDAAIGFPGGKGSDDMAAAAVATGIPVYRVR